MKLASIAAPADGFYQRSNWWKQVLVWCSDSTM
jgi:hypothetical protein